MELILVLIYWLDRSITLGRGSGIREGQSCVRYLGQISVYGMPALNMGL